MHPRGPRPTSSLRHATRLLTPRGASIHHSARARSPPSPRAPHLCSLGLPHLHSLGSRLFGKVTSAHSGARGFLGGGGPRRMHRRGRLRPSARAPTARRGRLEKAAGATGQVGGIRGSPRPAPGAVRTWGGIRTLDLRASEWEARKWGVQLRCASGVCRGSHQAGHGTSKTEPDFLEPEAIQTCWRGSLLVGSSPRGPQTFPGVPMQPLGPSAPARRAAAPPPVWYLHLSHICKLLSCPRLVTAEPSATDLAPLIFPPKSILHFPLIIPWLRSELSLRQPGPARLWHRAPSGPTDCPKGMVNLWGDQGGARGTNADSPPLLGDAPHSGLLVSPSSGSAFPLPSIWEGAKP